jgi:DNA-binding MarR family transcriptional regulator
MGALSLHTKICMNYAVVHTILSKKLDGCLSAHGISFSEFMILFQLSQTEGKMMRRIDLAEQIGLSASGVTRIVSPMEKIGLVRKEANKRDARVSLVKLSAAGQRIFDESSVSVNVAAEHVLAALSERRTHEMLKSLVAIGGGSVAE